MRISLVATGAALALGLAFGSVAVQSAVAAAPTTCGDLMQMSKADQTAFASSMSQAGTAGSLTSTSNNGGSTGKTNSTTTTTAAAGTANNTNGSDVNQGKMDINSLVAACQAATPATSLNDAMAHGMTKGANDGSGK